MLLRTTLLFLMAVCLAPAVAAQADWTVEDVLREERASNFVFSPDGTRIAWTKTRHSGEKDRNVTELWVTRMDRRENGAPVSIQLTRGEESHGNPFFSADNRYLYFTSSRDGGDKLWRIDLWGGEPEAVHTFARGFNRPTRINATTVVFTAGEGDLLIEQQREARKDQTQVIEDTVTFKPTRLFAFDLATKSVRRLTDNRFPISDFAVSADAKWAVTVHVGSPHYAADAQPAQVSYLWNLTDGTSREILGAYQEPSDFRFHASGSGFFFQATTSSDPEWGGYGISELYHYDMGSGAVSKVSAGHAWGLANGYELMGDDVVASLANGARLKWGIFSRSGSGWTLRDLPVGDHSLHSYPLAVAEDGRSLAYVTSRMGRMPEYRVATLDRGRGRNSAPRLVPGDEIVVLNADLKKKRMPRGEVVTWTGALNDQVTGLLYYPADYDSTRQYPLMVAIHGGPAAADIDGWKSSWAYYPQLLTQKGMFVLFPNYHGSSNHGLPFLESIKKGLYNELPDIDVMNGIHALRDRGLIDMDSLGIMGWSNGAIIGIQAVVRHPGVFKVLGSGAGDVNWTSDYGTCAFGVRFDQSYFGGAPWDDVNGEHFNRKYIDESPLFHMDHVVTPTIIFFGSEDRQVPRDQGWEHYRAMQQVGKAPVRFLWFPGMGHGLTRRSYQQRKVEEELAWFDRYLFGKADASNPAFKADSPLGRVLALAGSVDEEGHFGLNRNGILVPETVATGEGTLAVGRFEVTNAQFAAFRPEHRYPAAQSNHPAHGISQADAEAYVAWLSARTGESYRLPTAAEAEAWHRIAVGSAAKENTLSRWAGYELTVLDAPDLRRKAAELPPHRLLLPVGSFAPTKIGTAEVYDLGGNVAERHAGGGTYGFGATDVADSASHPATEAAFIGFRVVRP